MIDPDDEIAREPVGRDDAAEKEAGEKARWCWVLDEVARLLPSADRFEFYDHLEAVRYETPLLRSEHHQHIRAIALVAPKPASEGGCKSSTQAMRWACWAQGVCSAYGWIGLPELKRLNMRETWEEEKKRRVH